VNRVFDALKTNCVARLNVATFGIESPFSRKKKRLGDVLGLKWLARYICISVPYQCVAILKILSRTS
jgi:hypothetical protein